MAVDAGRYIVESPRITILGVAEGRFHRAWQSFRGLEDKPLSFTDCLSLAMMEENRIERPISFDAGFDGLAERIH